MCYMNLILQKYYTHGFTKKNCCRVAYVHSAYDLRHIGSQEIRKYRWNKIKSWNWLGISLLAWNSILLLPDCNGTQTHNQLAKWLSVRLRTKWLWFWVPSQSLKLQISRLFLTRSSVTFRQLLSVDSLWNAYVTW